MERVLSISNDGKDMMLEDWTIEEETGYEVKTTFYLDFSISEIFGIEGIRSTYESCFTRLNWNHIYITELCMVLNWKLWRWYNKNDEFYQLYLELYTKLDEWCVENLKGDELQYYYSTTD
jgi:hypothetical protein